MPIRENSETVGHLFVGRITSRYIFFGPTAILSKTTGVRKPLNIQNRQTYHFQGNRLRIYAESPTALERGFSLLRTSLELFVALERGFSFQISVSDCPARTPRQSLTNPTADFTAVCKQMDLSSYCV